MLSWGLHIVVGRAKFALTGELGFLHGHFSPRFFFLPFSRCFFHAISVPRIFPWFFPTFFPVFSRFTTPFFRHVCRGTDDRDLLRVDAGIEQLAAQHRLHRTGVQAAQGLAQLLERLGEKHMVIILVI